MIQISKVSFIFCFISLSVLSCNKTGVLKHQKSDEGSSLEGSSAENSSNTLRNLVIITFDGFRWEDLFKGADSSLLFNEKYTSESKSLLKDRFWGRTSEIRREKLMPFFWSQIANHGQLYGNRDLKSRVNVKNPYLLSYPGYSEIFTGYPDPKINSNDYGDNPNSNVLGFINKRQGYRNTVAAVSHWTAMRHILNVRLNAINLIAAGAVEVESQAQYAKSILDNLYSSLSFYSINDKDSANDKRVYAVAKSYLMQNHPRVLYISFGNTDNYGHKGKYDFYLNAAHNFDAMIKDLWEYLEHSNYYKNKTTLFITTDHGRGIGNDWTGHGSNQVSSGYYPHSDETWCAVIGPDTKALGEIKKDTQIYQEQYAQSFATFLGLKFTAMHPIANRVKGFINND